MQITIIPLMSTQINKNCSLHRSDFHLRVFDKRKERKKLCSKCSTPGIDRCWWRAGIALDGRKFQNPPHTEIHTPIK
jgi:hypothetical protein